jgi:protein ImuB
MQKPEALGYAVVYVPFYRLQCALLKRALNPGSDKTPQAFSSSGEGLPTCPASRRPLLEKNRPAALLDAEGAQVIELNPAAERAGIPLHVSTSLAVARAPDLLCLSRVPAWETHLQAALVQLAYRHSPYLEDTGPGICTLDLRTRREAEHEPWLRELLGQLEQLGLQAKAGLGPNPEVALQAASIADPLLELKTGSILRRALPLASFACSPPTRAILHDWGIRTLGSLACLPREEVGRRLGVEGLLLWDRAAGLSPLVLRTVQPPERFIERVDLDYPLETLEPLLFLLRRLLERLCFRLTTVYRLVAELRLTLRLEEGDPRVRTLQIPAPTRDADVLFRIVGQYLETVQATARVVGVELEAIPSDPGHHQFDLYCGGLKDPNRFFQTLARLAALIGNERVGVPERQDTHQPDRLSLRWPDFQWSQPPGPTKTRPRIGLALRRCRPGVPAIVQLAKECPVQVESSLVSGPVREVRGPWKLSGQWWDRSFWAIEEWDVDLGGGLYRLAREKDEWKLVGIYD